MPNGRKPTHTYASWVHGNAGHIMRDAHGKPPFGSDHHDDLYTETAAAGILRGFAGAHLYMRARQPSDPTTASANGKFWVHYPIPTPVIVAGNRSVASELIVRWKSDDTAKINFDEFMVNDGDDVVAHESSTLWGPEHQPERRIFLNHHKVLFGISVGLRVDC